MPRAVRHERRRSAPARAFWGVYAATKAALETMIACYRRRDREQRPSASTSSTLAPCAPRCASRPCPAEDPLTLPTPEDVASNIPQYLAAECTLHGERVVFAKRAKQ